MTMPTRHRRHRPDDRLPEAERVEDLRLPARRRSRATTSPPRSSRPATCSRTCPTSSTRATTASPSPSPRWTSGASTSGMVGAGTDVTERALQEHPDRFFGSLEVDPNDITGAVRKIRAAQGGARHQGGHDVPGRLQPAGAGQRPPLLPDLRDVHRARHPDLRQRGHRRAARSRRRARTSCSSTRSATTSPSCAS